MSRSMEYARERMSKSGSKAVFGVRERFEGGKKEAFLSRGRAGVAQEGVRDSDMPISFAAVEHGTVAAEIVKDARAPEPGDLLGAAMLLEEAQRHRPNRADIYPRLQCNKKARPLEVGQWIDQFEHALGSGHPSTFSFASASRTAERKAPRAMRDGSEAARAAKRSRQSSHASRLPGSPLRTKSTRWQAIWRSPWSRSLRARSRMGADPVAPMSATAMSWECAGRMSAGSPSYHPP